jgi:hypothetical protein
MTRLSTVLRIFAAVRAVVVLLFLTGCASVPDNNANTAPGSPREDAGDVASGRASRPRLPSTAHVPAVASGEADDDVPVASHEVLSAGTNADLIVQITEANRVVPPGGTMNLQYVLYSAEGNPGRVRLQLDAPNGWSLLDGAGEERPLEAWEIFDEELRIAVPAEAPPGVTHVLRLIAELVGEPGTSEALTSVQILNGGPMSEGDKYLAGTTTLGVSGSPIRRPGGGDVAGTVDL